MRETAVMAARLAGQKLLELYTQNVQHRISNTYDIKSEADLAAETIILQLIRERFPSHSILSEEAGEHEQQSEYLWIIDPLDGTVNYTQKLEEYGVSIALMRNGELELGIVYVPVGDAMYVAEKGKGASCNGRRIQVSQTDKMIRAMLGTAPTAFMDARKESMDILRKICTDVHNLRFVGSAAVDSVRIATGSYDVYYKTSFNLWDYAAGVVIVTEAGGTVTDFEGLPITKASKNIVMTNGVLHSEFLKLLKN